MIDDPDLLRFLQDEAARAKDEKLSGQRAAALDFYNGEPFGDEEEGRSQLVTRDVAEVIDYMAVSILRTMVSGDRVVEFESKDEAGRQAADDATALVQYDLMRRQRGYQLLHDFLKAGLLEKSGIVKSWVEQRSERVSTDVHGDTLVTDEAGAVVGLIDGTPVMDAVPIDDLADVYTVQIERQLPPVFRDVAVPNEEFLVASDARSLDEATYLAHVTEKSIAELVAMGFDEDKVASVWGDGIGDTAVSDARDQGRSAQADRNSRSGASRRVWLREEYPLYPVDGRLQRLIVHRVGTTILSAEPIDEQPFELWSPFPMPHRLIGQSLADKVMDIQRVRSVLLRQGMDNMYQSNSPRVLVNMDGIEPNTIDDVLTVRPGALIRYSGTEPKPFSVPFTADNAFQGMEMMAGEKESRTGITRLNQGLDADTLNKTATGTALMQAQGQQIEEYLARNFAEAVARILDRKRRLMKQHAASTRIQVNGQFRVIDPASWPGDMEMTIRVGLGTGRKDVRLQYRQMILAAQQAGLAAQSPLVSQRNVYNSLSGIIADMSLGNVSDFFTEPPEQQGEQEPPQSPEQMAAHAKAMLSAEELKGKQQMAAAELSLRQQESAAKVQASRDESALKLQLARDQAVEQAQLARDRVAEEGRLAVERLAMEERIALQRLAMERELAEKRATSAGDSGLSSYRPGGALDE